METYKECPECNKKYTVSQDTCYCGHAFTDDDLIEGEPEERIYIKIIKGLLFFVTSMH
jgi:hypothetical protein